MLTPWPQDPPKTCTLCPRLAEFRAEAAAKEPDWFNGAVPTFGPASAKLLIVGLAPGMRGANRTGRPFTGDYAGDLLYETLTAFGLAEGTYAHSIDDGLTLTNCALTNAVRCVPPQNKPIGAEIRTCNNYLSRVIEAMPELRCIFALGRIAHEAVLKALGMRLKDAVFAHAAVHDLPSGLRLVDSYHCSRYNTNTGRLTPEMFREAVSLAAKT